MAELAGFDVIAEFHIETVTDLVDLTPFTNPLDGKSIYLLGGPFSTDLRLTLPSQGTMTVRAIIEAELQPVLHQPQVKIAGTFDAGSMLNGTASLHIAGDFSVLVPMIFTSVASGPPNQPQQPVLLLSGTSPTVTLDAPTRSRAVATFGKGGANLLTSALQVAFAILLAAAGTRSVATTSFSILPGVDSADPTQLSAPPTVAWIDATTLGIFGYYRASATGGDVWAKTSSDLTQPYEEYFYDAPPPFPIMPGRRAAMLMSAEAFRMVIACPAVRSLTRSLVEQRDLQSWIDWERSQEGDAISQQMASELVGHYMAELGKDPHADPQTLLDRAKHDVQVDVDKEIRNRAAVSEKKWLDSPRPSGPESMGGQQTITACTPPPCGDGEVEITRRSVDLPIVTSDLIPMLRRLDIKLTAGHIAASFGAGGMLEVSTGDVYYNDTGEVDVSIDVDALGRTFVTPQVNVDPPTVHGTGFTGDLIDYLKTFFSGCWGDLMRFASLLIQQEIADAIKHKLQEQHVTPGLPQQPFETRMAQVSIDPQSLLAALLICRQPHWNQFSPGLSVTATLDSRNPTDTPPVLGHLHLKATEWGCPAEDFTTTRTFWTEAFSVKARLNDAPLPVTMLDWQMELGNFSWNSLGPAHYVDPRPTWSGTPVPIAAGQVTLAGSVEHLDPPIYPELHGPLTRARVNAQVSGSPDAGWKVTFAGSDGNFYVRLSADVRDGDGKIWHGETLVTHVGDQLELPPAYYTYKADCDAKYSRWERLRMSAHTGLVGIGQVQPGQPVENGEILEAIAIRTLIAAGDPSALRQLIAASERYGEAFHTLVGQVAPAQVSRKKGRPGQ